MERNEQILNGLEIPQAIERATSSRSPGARSSRNANKKGPNTSKNTAPQRQGCKQSQETAHAVQSPSKATRQQTMLQQQQISVVWGGELHCSNPLQSTTYCAYWPLDSLGLTSLMVWPGTTDLNRTVSCCVCG
jgi:hypothetical protein